MMTFSFLPKFTQLDFVYTVFTGSIIVSLHDVSFYGSFLLLCSTSYVDFQLMYVHRAHSSRTGVTERMYDKS